MEMVGMSNTGDSIISHKAEVLPEAKAEGPKRKRRRRNIYTSYCHARSCVNVSIVVVMVVALLRSYSNNSVQPSK
jgi:predicted anti-sigma-YlaC factor YlaD